MSNVRYIPAREHWIVLFKELGMHMSKIRLALIGDLLLYGAVNPSAVGNRHSVNRTQVYETCRILLKKGGLKKVVNKLPDGYEDWPWQTKAAWRRANNWKKSTGKKLMYAFDIEKLVNILDWKILNFRKEQKEIEKKANSLREVNAELEKINKVVMWRYSVE